ncbi:hypothetical protein HMPREF0497_1646 [Lentilactobacillus buchneri ATCC 11577]|nr:hypothetical protein HMPREF0497_1646 [Lentilactobacillus buchneri ATCC 11577]
MPFIYGVHKIRNEIFTRWIAIFRITIYIHSILFYKIKTPTKKIGAIHIWGYMNMELNNLRSYIPGRNMHF